MCIVFWQVYLLQWILNNKRRECKIKIASQCMFCNIHKLVRVCCITLLFFSKLFSSHFQLTPYRRTPDVSLSRATLRWKMRWESWMKFNPLCPFTNNARGRIFLYVCVHVYIYIAKGEGGWRWVWAAKKWTRDASMWGFFFIAKPMSFIFIVLPYRFSWGNRFSWWNLSVCEYVFFFFFRPCLFDIFYNSILYAFVLWWETIMPLDYACIKVVDVK